MWPLLVRPCIPTSHQKADPTHSTSGMAEDVMVLLDHLEWTAQRDLHVVGISLGGMIALGSHLADDAPTSLTFLCRAVISYS